MKRALVIMGVESVDLLEMAVKRDFLVAMLTAHSLSPESLRKSHDLGASACPRINWGKSFLSSRMCSDMILRMDGNDFDISSKIFFLKDIGTSSEL
jgi:hypothetical protein